MAIPPIIHYCWFGGQQLPKLSQECISSWRKKLPQYEIVLWNEHNFDTSKFIFTDEAARLQKWAFVTDFVRIYALYNYGGVYLDSDVEVKKPLDIFLEHRLFTGFERPIYPVTAIMGSEPNHPWLKELLDYYLNKHFISPNGIPDLTPNTITMTQSLLKRYGVKLNNTKQFLNDGICIYPQQYFCPLTIRESDNQKNIDNAFAIHWFSGSWCSPQVRFSRKIINFLIKIHLFSVYNYFRKIVHHE